MNPQHLTDQRLEKVQCTCTLQLTVPKGWRTIRCACSQLWKLLKGEWVAVEG